MSLDRENEEIEAKRSIEQILAEPAFVGAVKALEKEYLAEFADADSDEKRRTVWSKARVLQDLMIQLAAVMQRGKVAEATRTKRDAAEDRNRRANTRNSH